MLLIDSSQGRQDCRGEATAEATQTKWEQEDKADVLYAWLRAVLMRHVYRDPYHPCWVGWGMWAGVHTPQEVIARITDGLHHVMSALGVKPFVRQLKLRRLNSGFEAGRSDGVSTSFPLARIRNSEAERHMQEAYAKHQHTSDEPAVKKAKKSEGVAALYVPLRPLLPEGVTAVACAPPVVEGEHACGALSKADVLRVLKAGPKQGMSAPVLMTALSVGRSPPSIAALRDCLVQLMEEDFDIVRSPLEAKLRSLKDVTTLFRTWDMV